MRIAGKATKGKGKRWTKGSSSSSNPDNKRHRLQARSLPSVTTHSASDSRQSLHLSEDLLSQHNSIELQKLRLDNCPTDGSVVDNLDGESIGGQSFASVWTNCSNISFNKLLLGFDSSSATHKQMLSILAAITETIHSNGGKETETEYFAALMTCLESEDNSEETLTATLGLLQMVVKRLPSNVIRLKFGETSKVLVEYLAKYVRGENGLIVRSLITSLSHLLQQQENAIWELSSTKHVFSIILSLSVHNKPRIRKCAQKAIARLLKTDTNQLKSGSCHPIAKLTADFCIRKLEDNGMSENINTSLHVINLLTDILSVLPNPSLKKCCESMLTQMTFGNVLIVSTAFKAFFLLFAAKPREDILTPELNARLLSALYDYRPNMNDCQPLCAWFQAIRHALSNLYRIDKKLCFNHLPKLFDTSVACLLSDSREVHLYVVNTLKQVYTECIQESALEIDRQIVAKIYSCVERSLQYEYCNAWLPVFALVSHLFDANFTDFTANIIQKLTVIRESYDCVYAPEIDRTIGRAIQVFAPKYVVQLCPLDLNEESCDVAHNWLIPVLRDSTKDSELMFFVEYFIPLTQTLEKSVKSLESDGNAVSAKTCSLLISQIWSLLPSFCIRPNDFDTSFKKVAPILGSILSNKPSIRGYVLNAFRQMAKSLDNELVKRELNRFSKNFIPILFNIYTNEQNSEEEKNQKFAVFETIQMFFAVSDNSLLLSLYPKVMEKLEKSEDNPNLRHSLLDLIRAFVPFVGREDLYRIYNQLVLPFTVDNKQITEQKKAFRILEEICKNTVQSTVCNGFLDNNFNDVLNVLIESLHKCLSSSKSYALRALKAIIDENLKAIESMDWNTIFNRIIKNVLNCLAIKSQKVKTSSFELLLSIAKAFKAFNSENMDQFFEYMIAFIHKPEYSSSAVITCLTELYSEFRNQMAKHMEFDLVENVIENIGSDDRQTIQASVDFLKSYFRTAPADQLGAHLEHLINKISNINRRHKNHFRIRIREMFVRLVRKFGFIMISKMIPEEYRKVLKNIRKSETRKQKKSEDDSNSDSDRQTKTSKFKRKHEIQDIIADSSDEESEDEQMTTVSRKSAKSWIREESNESEIIDLLSSNLSQNILHKNPNAKPKLKKDSFEMSSDGRLVIQDLDKRGLKRAMEEGNDDGAHQAMDDDMDEDVMSNKQSVRSSRSKQSGYKTGGKGIHRPVDRETGQEYRSEKAKGDMKRKGKPDPYAYVPLNRQFLNRRKSAKLKGRFNNLVKAAKKGAKEGSTHRAKKMRRH